jgi:hypothetical protein
MTINGKKISANDIIAMVGKIKIEYTNKKRAENGRTNSQQDD